MVGDDENGGVSVGEVVMLNFVLGRGRGWLPAATWERGAGLGTDRMPVVLISQQATAPIDSAYQRPLPSWLC